MIRSEFSEFTFGYSFTENFANGWLGERVVGAPIFPSLLEEGREGGGYDVQIPTFAAPIFIQFKIPQIVTRRTSKLPHGFRCPYYRMHIASGARSLQHRALVEHAVSGKAIYYVCPAFDRMTELNTLFQECRVPQRCAFFEPQEIGPLTDEPHFLAFEAHGDSGWLYSDPRELSAHTSPEQFLRRVRSVAQERATRVGDRNEFLSRISREIVDTVQRVANLPTARDEGRAVLREPSEEGTAQVAPLPRPFTYERLRSVDADELAEEAQRIDEIANPLRRLASMAAFILDCQVVLVGRNE